MPPLTKANLSALEKAIDEIPDQTIAFRNQSQYHYKKRTLERNLFRKLLTKLAGGDKEDKIAFLVNQAQLISRKTYVKAVLESIPKQPDYSTLEKKNRPTHAHIHKLIDQLLPIVAGSRDILSQKRVFESRWQYLHNMPYIPTKMSLNSIEKAIELKFEDRNERIKFFMSQARKVNKKSYLHKAFESVPVPPANYSSLNKKDRRKYSHYHSLIDKVLIFAAGSTSPAVQLKLLETR